MRLIWEHRLGILDYNSLKDLDIVFKPYNPRV